MLEENIITFVKNELKNIQKVLSPDHPECLASQWKDKEMLEGENQKRSSREALLKMVDDFLRWMKQEELADSLQRSKNISIKIKCSVQIRHVFSN